MRTSVAYIYNRVPFEWIDATQRTPHDIGFYSSVTIDIGFSLIAHGVSASPLAKLLGQKEGTKEAST